MAEFPLLKPDEIHTLAAVAVPPGFEQARTPPLPRLRHNRIEASILVYRSLAQPTAQAYYPPHFWIVVDTSTGWIVQAERCTPQQLGRDVDPERAFIGYGLNHVPVQEFWQNRSELEQTSAWLWLRFREGATGGRVTERAKRFLRVFSRCIYVEMQFFCEAVAPEFFAWLRAQ